MDDRLGQHLDLVYYILCLADGLLRHEKTASIFHSHYKDYL